MYAMCGIIGCIGDHTVVGILLDGLRSMEYRGYDSAGICVHDGFVVRLGKGVGRVEEIARRLNLEQIQGNIGIAHTRWATHGGVTDENAHPHVSCDDKIAVVHNGIIENFQEIRRSLEAKGHTFRSTTDTEVIPHLIEEGLKAGKDHREAILDAVNNSLEGSYAFLVMFEDLNDRLYGARKDAPLIIGLGETVNFLASDVLAFLKHTNRAVFLDNLEVTEVRRDGYTIWKFSGEEVLREEARLEWEAPSLSKESYTHYTIKEIHEQKTTLASAFKQDSEALEHFCLALNDADRIYIIGAGTSYHAALLAKYLLIRLARLPVEVILASEFEFYKPLIDDGTILLAISQSGETADVLTAVNVAEKKGANILSIVNTPSSTLARESACTLYLNCGPEVGVAATKTFTAQLAVIYTLAFKLSNRSLDVESILETVGETFRVERKIAYLAQVFSLSKDCYFVGRGPNYPIALEGALKLKEIAYVHAEGLAAGELKHGTLALIERGVPVVALNPRDETYFDTLGNVAEMKARGARVIGVSDTPNSLYDFHVEIPKVKRIYYPLLEAIPLQLFAYYSAIERRQNPDYPRNLAKSVTVR